ncbi:MAG: GNAT family N-acetyltransferase [Acidimicrobiales bacterium]
MSGPTPDADRQSQPRLAGRHDAPHVAALHASAIPDGFLVTLGPRFLRRLYARITDSPHAYLLVTEDEHGLTGHIAIALHTGRLYRHFLLRDGVRAAVVAAPLVLKAPRRIWETLRYGTVDDSDLPEAEVLSIAVAPRARGHGIGTALLRAGVAELVRRQVTAAQVVTASDNAAALRMYERVGFVPVRHTEVHRGVSQEVLVWR